ncbi:unnamed protein product, partial [marine sediment metagenome]
PDPPVPGALRFLWSANMVFDVQVFSTRTHQDNGARAMRNWFWQWSCIEWGFPNDPNDQIYSGPKATPPEWMRDEMKLPIKKPPAFLHIDDRVQLFTGVFPDPVELLNFLPWNRKAHAQKDGKPI